MQDADRQCSALEKPQSSELRNRKRAAQKTSIRAERIRLFNKFIFMEENIMVVQHNLSAMNAQRYYGINNSGLSKSLEKLSSGYAINRAGDNAAGLAVSEKMRAQISGLTQASKNAQDGISMVQTFEGALTETDSILQRMRSLAVQSANGTYQNDVDREALQLEYDQLNDELNQIADTDFNGVVVLNGGTMADGLKQTNGEFDYKNGTRDGKQIGSAYSLGVGTAKYNFTAPDNDPNATSKVVDFTVKIEDNADGSKKYTWTASDGKATGTVENGGFTYDGATIGIDTSSLVNGDTVKVSFTKNTDEVIDVAKNFGSSYEKTCDGKVTTGSFAATADNIKSEELVDALNALNGAKITEDVDDAGNVTLKTTALTGTGDMSKYKGAAFSIDVDGNISYTSNTVTTAVKLGQWTKATTATNTKAGTIANTLVIGDSTYKAANPGAVKVVEPEGGVSKSNSNDASTANLTYKSDITLQVGARTKDSVNFTFAYESNGLGDLKADLDCSARGLGTDQLSLSTQKDANAAIDKIDNAINKVSMVRGTFGAIQNRLEHKISNLDTNNENLTAAESRIRDTEMDKEMMKFTSNQILSQAAQSMLAQANSLPQGVLQLLG